MDGIHGDLRLWLLGKGEVLHCGAWLTNRLKERAKGPRQENRMLPLTARTVDPISAKRDRMGATI